MAAALLAIVTPAQAKPPPGIEIKYEVGYNGWVQLGRINPLVVDMENTSADLNLSGELVLDYEGVEYASRLELPAPSRKRFYIYFPCDNYPPVLVLRVRTKAYTEQFEISTFRRYLPAPDANVLVLTSQGGSLGVLNQLPGVRLNRNLHDSHTAKFVTSKTFTAYYDLADVDPNPKFFARADAIVLADIDYQQVTPELAETLKACVSGGTSLIFSLGLNGAGVSASPLAEICPLRTDSTVQTMDLGSFGRHYGITTVGAPATLAVGSVAPGAVVSDWAGEYPVVARMLRGSGRVTALAFDFTAVPFKQNPALAPIFIDSALRVEDSVQVKNQFVHPQDVSDHLEGLSEARPMEPWFVFLFLLAYVALVGPANFFLLGKLKRRTLVWTTLPVIIIGFSYLGLSTGYFYRGSNNVTAYFQELHVFPGADYMPYQTTMLVFTAERTQYELEVPDKSAFLYPDVPMVVDQTMFAGGGRAIRSFSDSQVDNFRQPRISTSQGKWIPKVYFYRGYFSLGADAASNLSGTYGSGQPAVQGTFRLNLPFDLYNCKIYMPGGGSYNLGDIAGQGEYQASGDQTNIGGRLNADNYLVAAADNFRAGMASAVRAGSVYRDELLLVGFTEKVEALAEFKRPHAQHNLTMAVIHLPFAASVSDSGTTAISRTKLVGGAGFAVYDDWFYRGGAAGQTYLLPENSFMDLSYEVAGRLTSSNFLHLSLVGQSSQDNQPITDFSSLISIEIWDGERWRGVRVPPNEAAVDIPIGSAVDTDRRVLVRILSQGELILGVPLGDVW
jgi:hypothetical protein